MNEQCRHGGHGARTALRGLLLVVPILLIALNAQPIALAGIHVYQRSISPLAALAGFRCRFTPTCSRYAEIVIAREGAVRGGWRTLTRIVRCTPLTPPGTRDDP